MKNIYIFLEDLSQFSLLEKLPTVKQTFSEAITRNCKLSAGLKSQNISGKIKVSSGAKSGVPSAEIQSVSRTGNRGTSKFGMFDLLNKIESEFY